MKGADGCLRVFGGCCRVFEVCLKGVWKNKIEVLNPSDPPPVYEIISLFFKISDAFPDIHYYLPFFTIIHYYFLLSLLFAITHYYHYFKLLFTIIHYHLLLSLLFTIIIITSYYHYHSLSFTIITIINYYSLIFIN